MTTHKHQQVPQHKKRPHRRGFQWRLWGAPIAIAAISAIGLIAGLVGDGAWDVASWIGLGLPVAACVWFGMVRRTKR